jgi:hypothetical protein
MSAADSRTRPNPRPRRPREAREWPTATELARALHEAIVQSNTTTWQQLPESFRYMWLSRARRVLRILAAARREREKKGAGR